ncbi:C-3 sterol dehydrogenase [Lentinula raphanica]|nr:C-3 sterol dehydrogenase [Lentinula raphanica]
MASTKDVYLVIGGSGSVGRHIVEQLLRRGDNVSVFDIVQRYQDVPFYSGDISDQEQVSTALRRSGTTCIIHTASPPAGLSDPALYWKVNVDGTKAPPERPMDAYNESKQKAEEAVIAANGKGGLLTVALSPAGIFGPGDRQDGKTHYQIGDNTNLFDWTYVENVAHAHAADKLDNPPPAPLLSTLEEIPLEAPPLTKAEVALLNHPLPPLDLTVGRRCIPTSEARPLGPYVTPPPNADKLVAAFEDKFSHPEGRPVVRTRFDPLSEPNLFRTKFDKPDTTPLGVAGQLVWNQLDTVFPGHRQKRGYTVLPAPLSFALAFGAGCWGYCVDRWHNIEKARRVLGYEPQVGLADGVQRMVDWWRTEYTSGTHKITH